ncbi:unnamed protein product [Camellia sinensis]
MGIVACIGVVSPFPFYYCLWIYPQRWVDLCGKGRDPSKIMAIVSHLLKLLQFLSLFSVSSLSWPPPFYFWPLFLFGQFLNFRVYQLLGESGTYYGVRFGKNIPWATEFPFGVINDPQYVGSILSLFACLSWNLRKILPLVPSHSFKFGKKLTRDSELEEPAHQTPYMK